jgi:hypothetical protein
MSHGGAIVRTISPTGKFGLWQKNLSPAGRFDSFFATQENAGGCPFGVET